MIIKSIQSLKNVWPTFTKYTEYKTTVDPKTNKEHTEITVYRVYNKRGVIETNQSNKVDIKV